MQLSSKYFSQHTVLDIVILCVLVPYCEKPSFTPIYMLDSKCSRNRFISEKNKKLQSFMLHFLQNCPHVQLCTSASDCESVGNILASHFVKAFSAFPSHS